jgi:hypothetical protein
MFDDIEKPLGIRATFFEKPGGNPLLMGISPVVKIEGQVYWADTIPDDTLEALHPDDKLRIQRIKKILKRIASNEASEHRTLQWRNIDETTVRK